jgi:aminoglycoside phosphotransferase (APT) family kinase protein
LLPDVVPVPEVFGWCQDGNEVFIYMQMVRGATLEERWEALTREERVDICEQLRPMVGALRQRARSNGSICGVSNSVLPCLV